MPEVEVTPGQHLQLIASHDTYSISYSLPSGMTGPHSPPPQQAVASREGLQGGTGGSCGGDRVRAGEPMAAATGAGLQATGVPLCDPVWRAAFEQLQGLNGQLVKACVQNPLEYRALAMAALQFAARPHDLGVDTQQAAEFCVKMMG